MSFIASMVSTAVVSAGGSALLGGTLGVLATGAAGAGLGAGLSAATGGDPGEGALLGGIGGLATGGAGLAFAPAGAASAGAAGAGGNIVASQIPQTALQTTSAGALSSPLITPAATNAGGFLASQIPQTALQTASAGALSSPLIAPAAAPGFLGSIGEFAAAHPIMTSAGVGALGGAVTNPNDPLGGAIKGGTAGAIGGWGASELGSMAGSAGAMGKIGSFAAEHPGITSAGIGMLASPIVGAITPSFSSNKDADLSQMNETDRQNFLRYMRNYTPSLSPGYAAGGITDLDGYMSNAQNIPNPQEVADPEGYGSNSMRLMAGGGLANLIPGGQDVANWLAKNSLPGMIFGWEGASDVPVIGGMFNDPNIANLTPEEKKKLMDNMAAAQGKPVQQMAQGGIADLGGYAAGGRPNLLHGPGDGVSDDIPASIAGKQPARLASGEYVIPSRIVSELGNGSTDAGAKRLDMMVQKVNAGRAQTLGGKKYAKDTRAYKHLPV